MNDEGTAPAARLGAVPFLMCGEEGKRPRRFPPHPIRDAESSLSAGEHSGHESGGPRAASRGASVRRNKGLRAVKHHVPLRPAAL